MEHVPRLPTLITHGTEMLDGAGVRVRRLLGTNESPALDPFLLLDYFDSDRPEDHVAGFPPHPHRGFETVTYMLGGRMRYHDNRGRRGVVEPGGMQWMTAGRGVIHSEMPEQIGGALRGFQLWVNLPAKLKMCDPAYTEFAAARIPIERRPRIETRVIAGVTSRGTVGAMPTSATQTLLLDVNLESRACFEEPLAPGFTGFVIAMSGVVGFSNGKLLTGVSLATLGTGNRLTLYAPQGPARVLLAVGLPLHEPVIWQGPFVMNNTTQIIQAVRDFQAGEFA